MPKSKEEESLRRNDYYPHPPWHENRAVPVRIGGGTNYLNNKYLNTYSYDTHEKRRICSVSKQKN